MGAPAQVYTEQKNNTDLRHIPGELLKDQRQFAVDPEPTVICISSCLKEDPYEWF